jgi:sugar phosphate isomerase/epimerase
LTERRCETVSGGAGRPSDPRQWAVGTSTALFHVFDSQAIEECREAGLDCIELGIGHAVKAPADLDAYAARAEAIRRAQLQLWSVHLPFGGRWDISAPDATVRELSLDFLILTMARVRDWGAQVAVVHPSAEPIAPADRPARLARSKESLARLTEAAERYGIWLAVECLPRTCLGNTSEEMLALLEGIAGLEVTFDTNHPLQELPEHFAARLSGRIATLHISDYDGVDERHWLPGQGTINWIAVIANLAAGGYTGPFMFEVTAKAAPTSTPADLVSCWRGLLQEAVRVLEAEEC